MNTKLWIVIAISCAVIASNDFNVNAQENSVKSTEIRKNQAPTIKLNAQDNPVKSASTTLSNTVKIDLPAQNNLTKSVVTKNPTSTVINSNSPNNTVKTNNTITSSRVKKNLTSGNNPVKSSETNKAMPVSSITRPQLISPAVVNALPTPPIYLVNPPPGVNNISQLPSQPETIQTQTYNNNYYPYVSYNSVLAPRQSLGPIYEPVLNRTSSSVGPVYGSVIAPRPAFGAPANSTSRGMGPRPVTRSNGR